MSYSRQATEEFGRIDILVNNAGTDVGFGSIARFPQGSAEDEDDNPIEPFSDEA